MKSTGLLLLLLGFYSCTVKAQGIEDQLKGFIPPGYSLADSSGEGLRQSSGDILLELVSDAAADFETLVILNKEKGKLRKIAENSSLLMSTELLGVSGGSYPSLSGNILSVDYSVGSGSALSEISIQFEKSDKGQYLFKQYTSTTSNHGVENLKETRNINASQTGFIDFSSATEDEILRFQNRPYYYEPEISTITGMLFPKQFYGRPNYGETPEKDERIWVYILKTDSPINVYGKDRKDTETADKTITGISEIQVYSTDRKLDFKAYEGRSIQLQGFLQPAQSPHHYTPIIFQVKKII